MLTRRDRALLCLVVLLLSLLACAAEGRRSRKLRAANRRGDFDFFFLVRQWPATFCNDHACTHRPPKKYEFTLHGMWPQRRDGTWPEYCDPSSHIDMDALDDLVDEMEHDWPSWSSTDETFWDHEWNRHGTCAAPVTGNQHRFFGTVLGLHHKLNIQAALTAAGIKPSNSQRYPVQDIKDAIENMYGVMPHVTCDARGALSEVWMCINKKLRVIDCVEDPRPPHAKGSKAAAAAASGLQQAADAGVVDGDLASALAPPNYNCKMVMLPKLQRHWGKSPGLDPVLAEAADSSADSHHHSHKHSHKHHADHHKHKHSDEDDSDDEEEAGVYEEAAGAEQLAVADLAAAIPALVESAAEVVQELAEEAVESLTDGVAAAELSASLSAVKQAAATAAVSVAEAVVAAAAPAASATAAVSVADEAPVTEAALAEASKQKQQQPSMDDASAAAAAADAVVVPVLSAVADRMQQQAVAGPNQHLPLLAGVVVGVVAAAVVAAAVALRAAPCAAAEAQAKARNGYVPPGGMMMALDEPQPGQLPEAAPLLASIKV